MTKLRILFVCTYFGGRAKTAELYAQKMALGQVDFFSSGFESGVIGGLPLAVMEEEGFEFPTDPLTTVFERYANNEIYNYVITLCHDTSMEQCPMFRDSVDMIYGKNAEIRDWSIRDFTTLRGLPDEKLIGARDIRDSIKQKVSELLLAL